MSAVLPPTDGEIGVAQGRSPDAGFQQRYLLPAGWLPGGQPPPSSPSSSLQPK